MFVSFTASDSRGDWVIEAREYEGMVYHTNPTVPPTQSFTIRPIGYTKMPSIILRTVCLIQWNEWCVISEEQAPVNLFVW